MPLNSELVRMFRHNGYIVLPQRLPGQTVNSLRQAIRHDIEHEVEPVDRDASGQISRISQIWERGGVFQEVLAAPMLLDAMESLIGPNIVMLLNRHNHATLRLSGETGTGRVHRDNLQWTRSMATVIFYLADTNVENGCTHVIPGSDLLSLGTTNLHAISQDLTLRDTGVLDQLLPVPVEVGGMLVIDGMLLHCPGENKTDKVRTSMTAGYHAVDELASVDDPARVLVRGNKLYQGNRPKASTGPSRSRQIKQNGTEVNW